MTYEHDCNNTLFWDDNFLEHYGVPGMKWGVRRYVDENGHLTDAGLERYGFGKSGKAVIRRADKLSRKADKAIAKAEEKAGSSREKKLRQKAEELRATSEGLKELALGKRQEDIKKKIEALKNEIQRHEILATSHNMNALLSMQYNKDRPDKATVSKHLGEAEQQEANFKAAKKQQYEHLMKQMEKYTMKQVKARKKAA